MNWNLVSIFLLLSPLLLAMVESPKGCLQQAESSACYFGSISKIVEFQVDENVLLHLGKNTVAEKSDGKFVFHEGQMAIEVSSQFSLYIKKIKIDFLKGEYLIKTDGDKSFVVRTLQGEAQAGLAENKVVQVTEGFDLLLIDRGQMGLEQAPLKVIPLEEHLLTYAKLKKMSKPEIVKYTQSFSKKHENYVRWASELNDQLVQRQIAVQEEIEQQKRVSDNLKKRRREQMRKQLYEKVFER